MPEPVTANPVQFPLPRVAKRRMAEVVAERNRLCQILVHAQCLCNRSGILGNLKRMRQPRAVMVAFRGKEYLCLPFQPAKRL